MHEVRVPNWDADPLIEDLEAIAAMRRHYRWKRDLVAPHLGPRVVEVGCGTGLMLEQLAGRELLVGIDRNPRLLERAEARLRGRPEVRLLHRDMQDPAVLALRTMGPTGVLFANSLELMDDDAKALAHAAGVLSSGGRVVALTWAMETPPPALQPTYGLRGYAPLRLQRLLTEAGLRDVAIRWVNLLGILGWWLDRRSLGRAPLMGARAFARRDRIIPLARFVDAVTGPPRGRLILAVGTKP